MKNVQIKNIEFTLGKKKEKYSDLSKNNPLWDTKRILDVTGIKTRYLSKDEDIISLSLKSAKKVLKKFSKKKYRFFNICKPNLKYKTSINVMHNTT